MQIFTMQQLHDKRGLIKELFGLPVFIIEL